MTLPIANISLANTFGHWVERTNELADAMSNFAITVGGNAAVGNAVVHGKFTANTIEVDTLTKFNGGNVTISTADLVVSNTASLTTIGTVSIKGSMNVDAVASIKIAGANTTHRVVSVINANGNLGFIKVELPHDH